MTKTELRIIEIELKCAQELAKNLAGYAGSHHGRDLLLSCDESKYLYDSYTEALHHIQKSVEILKDAKHEVKEAWERDKVKIPWIKRIFI